MSTDLATTTGTWTIDPTHTTISFSARHAMIAKVRGQFNEFTGTLTLDGQSPARSTADLTIMSASIDTNNLDRDAHLKSADFLDVDQFPTITFTTTSVKATADGFIVSGVLDIHGIAKPVDVTWELIGINTDPFGAIRIGFEGHTEISRKEFGLVWNVALEAGGVLVGDAIKLSFDVEAVKQV